MAKTQIIHVRVDEQVKEQATKILASMGLSISDAIRIFLATVVADQAMPFAINIPNAASREAIAEADHIISIRRARFTGADPIPGALEEADGDQMETPILES